MKKLYILFGIVAVLTAVVVPANAMALMSPSYETFVIQPENGVGDTISTPLGSCGVHIEGTVYPTAEFGIPTPYAVNCKGASLSFAGGWKAVTTGAPYAGFHTEAPEGMTMYFPSSRPGCKLVLPGGLVGTWTNGTISPRVESTYRAYNTFTTAVWANSGTGTCAWAGLREAVSYEGPAVKVTHPIGAYPILLN